MTEKYIELRSAVEKKEREIENLCLAIKAKIDAGVLDGLREQFDEYNRNIKGFEEFCQNNKQDIFKHLADGLAMIANSIGKMENIDFLSKEAMERMQTESWLLKLGRYKEFPVEHWVYSSDDINFPLTIDEALDAGVMDAECVSAIEDIYDYINGDLRYIYTLSPAAFPLLSDDAKVNYLNSHLNSYCDAVKYSNLTESDFSQESIVSGQFLYLISINPQLTDCLNENNIQNIDKIKDTLSRIENVDFDILDESAEQANAEIIKSVLSRIVSIAEPIERETDILRDDVTVL